MNDKTNEIEIPEFETYEEALELVATARMEIKDLFGPAKSRQKKLWKMIFNERDTGKFEFAKKLMYYQAGVPKEDSKSKMEGLRKQVAAMVEIMFGLGLGENIQAYFREVGVEISLTHDKYAEMKNFSPSDKIEALWDLEFFGEELPYKGVDTLKMLMDHAKATEDDIVKTNLYIDKIVDEACFRFNLAPAGFKKAADLTFKEKLGKDVSNDIAEFDERHEKIKEALSPFFEDAE